MDNPNVKNLVDYLKKYSNFPFDKLVETVLKSGHSKEDLNQALEIIRSPQEAAPTAPPIPPQPNTYPIPQKQGSSKNGLVFALIGITASVALLGLIIGLKVLNKENPVKKDSNKEQIKQDQTSSPSAKFPDKIPTPSLPQTDPTAAVSADPMAKFWSKISADDYKITSSGKIEYKKGGSTGTQTTSLDLNNGTIYIKTGSVVRIEKSDTIRPEIGIIKNHDIYSLNPRTKTFVTFKDTDSLGKLYVDSIRSSFPLLGISDDTQKGQIIWQKTDADYWEANWAWKTPLDEKSIPAYIRVKPDFETDLINDFSIRFDAKDLWQDVTFVYEKVININSLLTVPSDYTLEKISN